MPRTPRRPWSLKHQNWEQTERSPIPRRKAENVPSVTSFQSSPKNASLLLSIFSVRDDYKMNDPARKAVPLAPTRRRRTTKYICLEYLEPGKFEGMTEDERHATFGECFEDNDHLRANGHLVVEVPLQPPETFHHNHP